MVTWDNFETVKTVQPNFSAAESDWGFQIAILKINEVSIFYIVFFTIIAG